MVDWHQPSARRGRLAWLGVAFLLLVVRMLLVAMPGAPSSFLFLVRPGAPSSVLARSIIFMSTSVQVFDQVHQFFLCHCVFGLVRGWVHPHWEKWLW